MKKILVLLVAATMIFVFAACRNNEPENTDPEQVEQPYQSEAEQEEPIFPELVIESIEEDTENIIVKTSYCTVKYPYAFSDITEVEAENFDKRANLCFYANIDGFFYPAYTIAFNGTDGSQLGKLDINDKESVTVSVILHERTDDIEEEIIGTFNVVQETVNDIIVSLYENDNFILE